MDNARTTQLPSPTLPTLPGQTLRISVLYMDQNLSSHIQIPNFGFMIFQRRIEYRLTLPAESPVVLAEVVRVSALCNNVQ